MASTTNVILGTAAALIVWTIIGLAVARAVLPQRVLQGPVAPALGWAVHSAATLPLFMLIGFNRITVDGRHAAVARGRRPMRCGGSRRTSERDKDAVGVPYWAWIGALILTLGARLRDPAEIRRRRRDPLRPDLRSRQGRHGRRDDPAGAAAGQSVLRRRRTAVAAGLLLPPAFQRGRDCAAARDHRLGSGRRADLVQRLRIADADDRPRHLAQRTQARGAARSAGLHERIAAAAARTTFPASMP